MLFKGVYGNNTCYSFIHCERIAEINKDSVRKRRLRLYRKAPRVRSMLLDTTRTL